MRKRRRGLAVRLRRARLLQAARGGLIPGLQAALRLPLPHGLCRAPQLLLERGAAEAERLLIVVAAVERRLAGAQRLAAGTAQLGHQLAEVRLRVLRLEVEHALAVFVGAGPVPVLEEQERAP